MIKLVAEPRVEVIQHSIPLPIIAELADEFAPNGIHPFEEDASVLEVAPIFAGRNCYQSFGTKAGRKTAEDYLGHIKEVKHFSIVEHSSVTFFIDGVSRSFTHELVRHRIASYSQLSQRFVAPDELAFIVPPAYRDRKDIIDRLEQQFEQTAALYAELLDSITDDMPVSEKKAIREAARCVLPNATETKIVVTMDLRAWLEFLSKRVSPAADAEIRQVAGLIQDRLVELAPNIFTKE